MFPLFLIRRGVVLLGARGLRRMRRDLRMARLVARVAARQLPLPRRLAEDSDGLGSATSAARVLASSEGKKWYRQEL